MIRIISSQRYLDPEIVSAKRAAGDYRVTLLPIFEVDGEQYQLVIGGHHSLAAARAAGVEPEYVLADESEDDRLALLRAGDVEAFLEAEYIDSAYYDVSDGRDVW
jgi:hypothetical protein